MTRTRLYLIAFTLLLPGMLMAQRGDNWCGHDHHQDRLFEANPQARSQWAQDEADIRARTEQLRASRDENNDRIVVPTVVHIFHDGGVGNISDEQVASAIRILNEDFQRRGPDTNETRDVFMPHAGCADFEFRLARLDPNGNATNGITRTDVGAMSYDADDAVKNQSWWPGADYYNIWVVNTIESSGAGGTILGYAYFPGTANWNAEYGVIIRNDQFGDIGTSNGGRTLTHEAGHTFALRHTFQSGCGGNCSTTGDQLCDTPPVFEDTQGCSTTQNTCGNDLSGPSPYSTDVVDQIENYMSYDDCQNMFSNDQVSRMRASVENSNTLTGLVSPINLAQTGVDQLTAANFDVTSRLVCMGDPIIFLDESTYGQNEWTWQFAGGQPETSDEQYPSVLYSQPGLYDVALTAGNGVTSLSELKTNYVMVMPDVGRHSPHTENFEGSFPNEDWIIFNQDDGFNKWEHTTAASVSGSSSMRVDNFGNADGELETLVSSTFDLSNLQSATVSFKLAYAQRNSSHDDKLRMYVSVDCGQTWLIRWAGTGAGMATAPATLTEFVPAADEWEDISVNLTSSNLSEKFQIMFEFESNQGNHLYIDDINISGNFDPVPVLEYPEDEEAGLPDALTLDWKSVGFVDSYELELDISPAFTSSALLTTSNTYISVDPNNEDTEHDVIDLIHGQEYFWRVRSVAGGIASQWSDIWSFTVSDDGVGFGDPQQASGGDLIVYPNPVNDVSTVAFTLEQTADVSLKVYDTMGREVQVLDQGKRSKGVYQYELSKNSLKSGVYLVRLQINNDIRASKILVK